MVEWVSDQLHELLGLSDRYTAEYFVGLARKAASPESYLQQLKKTGAITVNDAVSSFAGQLWNRVPHKAPVEKPARARERELILQRQRNKAYQLLSDDEDEDLRITAAAAAAVSRGKQGYSLYTVSSVVIEFKPGIQLDVSPASFMLPRSWCMCIVHLSFMYM